MNMKNKIPFILIFLLIIAFYTIAYTIIINEPPHHFRLEECIQCHVSMPVDGAKKETPMRFVDNINRLCYRCHTQDIQLSHPVGMRPSMRVPADMPLDEKGEVTCATCHNIHQSRENILTDKTYLLRRNTIGKTFCIACHAQDEGKKGSETFSVGMKKIIKPTHREFISEAHGFKKYMVIDRNSPIDPVSAECIGCHDGTVGSDTQIVIGAGIWQHGEMGVSSHPIGVSYAAAQANDRTLRHMSELNPAIKFFDGKIGCGSCHDPYSISKTQLVMNNKGSALCLECHKK
jgi:predicted CXXCH cytochrome family protein